MSEHRQQQWGHVAVVIGGSIGGLLAARVLSEHFRSVRVVEKDARPRSDSTRKGAPQGHHGHILLQSGQDVLAALFPGIVSEWRRAGARPVDFSHDVAWSQYGRWRPRFRSDYRVYPLCRPALEESIRRRVESIPNVQIAWSTSVRQPIFSAHGQVIGLVARGPSGADEAIAADLVVDASGFGSRMPQWLQHAGYDAPEVESIELGLGYTSAVFTPPVHARHWNWRFLFVPPGRRNRRGGMILDLGDGRWSVTLYGYGGDHAPTELEDFRDFAETLSSASVWAALAGAQQRTELKKFAIPVQLRRRYERLDRFPEGLLVMGDAGARIDPAFGQGMSVAALQARELNRVLERARGTARPLDGLARAFHQAAARVLDTPWSLTATKAGHESRKLPRPLRRLVGWYRKQATLAGASVPAVHRAFLSVQQLKASPRVFYRPDLVIQVLFWRLRGGTAAASS